MAIDDIGMPMGVILSVIDSPAINEQLKLHILEEKFLPQICRNAAIQIMNQPINLFFPEYIRLGGLVFGHYSRCYPCPKEAKVGPTQVFSGAVFMFPMGFSN